VLSHRYHETTLPSFPRHDGGPVFITAHDDFEEVFAGVFGELFEAKIVDDQQLRLEIAAQGFVPLVEGFVFENVAHQIKDGAIEHLKVHLDSFVTQCLAQVRFADAGRPEEQHVFGFPDKSAGGQSV